MSAHSVVAVVFTSTVIYVTVAAGPTAQQAGGSIAAVTASKLETLKRDAAADIDSRAKFTQQTNDLLFSFAELGFQEFETSKYIVRLLRENGFAVQEGV